MQEWKNWSGSVKFHPSHIASPRHVHEITDLVSKARNDGRVIRPVGSSHSSTKIYETDDILLNLDHFNSFLCDNTQTREALVGAGIVLRPLGEKLLEAGLSPHNLGDVALQTISGAISTGTHGTGRKLKNLSSMLAGGKIVTGTGEIRQITEAEDPELLKAMRISLGSFGIWTEMWLKLLPAYQLRRQEYFTTVEPCLVHLDELISNNRNFDFYWYPRSDEVKLRLMNEPEQGMADIKWAKLVEDRTGWANEVLHKHSDLTNKFDEMEFELPIEAGPECFLKVRERIRKKWRKIVAWRLLYRTIAADDAYLSPAHGRDSVSISIHQNASLPHSDFFADIEPILKDFGGRPHWAKKHSMTAKDLKPLYPQWDKFMELRKTFDPEGIFLSPYLKKLFGLEACQ